MRPWVILKLSCCKIERDRKGTAIPSNLNIKKNKIILQTHNSIQNAINESLINLWCSTGSLI